MAPLPVPIVVIMQPGRKCLALEVMSQIAYMKKAYCIILAILTLLHYPYHFQAYLNNQEYASPACIQMKGALSTSGALAK